TIYTYYLLHAQNGEDDDGNELIVGQALDHSKYANSARPIATIDWSIMRRCVSRIAGGLAHLEGCRVTALCDGLVYDTTYDGLTLIVEDGALPEFEPELGIKFARIHVGLPYQSRLHTLDFLNTQADDNGVKKIAGPTFIRVENTRGRSEER